MTSRVHDTNGWYEIKRNPISKVGVFPYLGKSIGAPEPTKVYRVYRPASELGHPDTIDSFRLTPLVDDHTMLGDDGDLMPAERKGVHGVIGDEVFFDRDTLYGNVKVWSKSLNAKIKGGKRELSGGYRCSYDFTSGTCEYGDYDVIQRSPRGNHVALVDRGRMGPDVHVLDHFAVDLDDAREPIGMDPELKAYLDKLTAGMDTAIASIPGLITAAVAPVVQSAVDAAIAARDSDEDDPTAGMSEDEKADFLAKAKADKEAADTDLQKQITKAVDSAFAAHAKTFTPAKPTVDAMDAKAIGASIARAAALAERAKPHIGVFDAAGMDELDVAKYALDKLGKKDVPDAAAVIVLDTMLTALVAPKPSVRKSTEGGTAVDAYLSPAE